MPVNVSPTLSACHLLKQFYSWGRLQWMSKGKKLGDTLKVFLQEEHPEVAGDATFIDEFACMERRASAGVHVERPPGGDVGHACSAKQRKR